ncbi:LolA-related protein [Nitrospira lenta]|uniref:Putative lipoprotein n=1 Tax=Nitrospira lenta TaxID=1436998 RepID=A0A330L4Q6_9BACT|nr:LolA-related protein [Nitrospira lenta]SPP64781.1 putative lipoprotein [Nitrospira lenta]
MIFGKPLRKAATSFSFLLVLLLGSVAPAAVDAPPAPWTVDGLVALLKEQREPSMAFEEATYSSLLTEPLIVKGQLRFTPPATMEKAITQPFRERYVIEGDRVLFESERKGIKRTISLEDYPALRSFVDAFRASFTGDAARLQKVYEATLEGTRRQWTLLLRPREQAGRSMVDYILFTGSEGRVATIAIRSPDGDRSVMTLLHGAAR